MPSIIKNTTMTDNTYTAWVLYTGARDARALWYNSRWITGEWTGCRGDDAQEIRADIDRRIQCLIEAFSSARNQLTDAQKVLGVHYFVVPEAYFHCGHGPYPQIKIDGLDPYSYIRQTLERRFHLSLLPDEVWIVCVGSILTCTEQDINGLLGSQAAVERLRRLNAHVRQLFHSPTYVKPIGVRALSLQRLKPSLHPEECAIDALMNEYRASPLCIVHNRGLLLTVGSKDVVCREFAKQNESSIDLTLGILRKNNDDAPLQPGVMVTEWLAGYSSVSIYSGDKNCLTSPLAARMTIHEILISDRPLELGVEICLDHALQRLRRTAAMTKALGAHHDNPPLHVQIIPSAGAQISAPAITAGVGGVIFNCDGCNPVQCVKNTDTSICRLGEYRGIVNNVYSSFAQMNVTLDGCSYGGHSQLSFRYGDDEIGGYDNALGTANTWGTTYGYDSGKNIPKNPALDRYAPPKRITPNVSVDCSREFVAGIGELHIYAPQNA